MPRLIGWREWAALPELGIDRIRLKADSGARTSALHAVAIRSFKRNDEEWVEFELGDEPSLSGLQQDSDESNDKQESGLNHRDPQSATQRQARVVDHRTIRDSGGHEELRVTIETTIVMANQSWSIQLTLTDREAMGYRMLLGRTAMEERFYVDPGSSYILGDPVKNSLSADRQEEE